MKCNFIFLIIVLSVLGSIFASQQYLTTRAFMLQNTVVSSYGAEAVSLNPAMLTTAGYENTNDEIYLCNTRFAADISSFYLSFLKTNYSLGIDFFYYDYGEIKSLEKSFNSNISVLSLSKKFYLHFAEVGINVFYRRQKIDIYSNDIINLNVGVKKNLNNKLITAFVVKNILSTEYKFIETREKLPILLEAGIGYIMEKFSFFSQINYSQYNNIYSFPISIEYKITQSVNIGFGYDTINFLTNFGCSILLNSFFVDVGYSSSILKTFSISVGYFL